MKVRGGFLVWTGLLVGPLGLSAQTALHLGSEFPVNTYTTGGQSAPVVAAVQNGKFAVVWQSLNQDGDGTGVFGQWFDPVAAKTDPEFQVNTYTTGRQGRPAAAIDFHGNLVVVWESDGQDGSGTGVFGQRYNAKHAAAGGEFRVNTTTASNEFDPAIAAAPDGNFVVVWTEYNAGSPDVRAQRFDIAGAKLGGEFLVDADTAGGQLDPAVAADAAGRFVVVWSGSGASVGDDPGSAVLGQRFDAAGAKIGPVFQVNTYTTGSQTHPAIAMDRAGNFVVVWQNYPQDGAGTGIFAQRFNNGAEKLGGELAVNTYTTNSQFEPSIALERDGGFVVAWTSEAEDGSGYGVVARRFDRSGAPSEPEFVVNTSTAFDQREPSIVAAPVGLIAVWNGRDTGSSSGIIGRLQTLLPEALLGDDHGVGNSNLNGVVEPGEALQIEPSWRSREPSSITLQGTVAASDFGGPPGPTYALFDGLADYGGIGSNNVATCAENPSPCFAVQVFGTRPGAHWDATLKETLSLGGSHTWTLHVGDSFTDVPRTQPFYKKIETLLHNGVTSGCTPTQYCPGTTVSRGQMAIFIAKGMAGAGEYVPTAGLLNGQPYDCSPGGVSRFADVAAADSFCRHVHYLGAQNVTLGCSASQYCPGQNVTRDAMASFIAKALVAPGGGNAVPLVYSDPDTGLAYSCALGSPNLHFSDVPVSHPFCRHIHFLWAKGIVSGCSATQYCPAAPVARDAMAKFLANGFGLKLYGP